MNKVNIIEIIDKAPRKLELYCSVLGRVVDIDKVFSSYVISLKTEEAVCLKGMRFSISETGAIVKEGECILFPSKEYRTWKHWQRVLFKEGDLITDGANVLEYQEGLLTWDQLDKFIWKKKIDPIFKVGQYITRTNNDLNDPKQTLRIKELLQEDYKVCGIDEAESLIPFEKQNDYKDGISSVLKPFQEVLVRDNRLDVWRAAIYSHFDVERNRYVCSTDTWMFCIPYAGNEKLVGKRE